VHITRQYINGLEYKEQLAFLKKDGMLLQLIDNQTEELCRAAVKQNGNAIRWVQDMELKILLELVRSWGNISPGYINSYKNKKKKRPESFDSALVDCCNSRIKGWIDDNKSRKNISAYSALSGKKLNLLHDKLSKKYAKLFNDETIGIEERLKRIDAAIAGEKNTKFKVLLKDFIREWFYRHLRALSILVFFSMERRGDYGDLGQDHLYAGVFRNIMEVSNDGIIMPSEQIFFELILNDYDSANGFKSGEEYLALTKDLSLELFGKILNENEISGVINFLETDGLTNIGGDRNGLKFLFGRMEEKIVDGTTVKIYVEEYARSPQYTLCNVGWAGKNSITIRREALHVVFTNKWVRFFPEMFFVEVFLRTKYKRWEINSAICDGLRRKALKLYHVYNTKDVDERSGTIFGEMEEGVISHEIGHKTVNAFLINPVHENIRGAFCCDGDNVVYTIREAEADWTAAIPWFIAIAGEKGPEAGARVVWVYFSDNWFLHDDEDEYFTLMAKVQIGLLLPFFNNDQGLFDFSTLALRQESIRKQLSKRMEKIILRLLTLIEVSDYRILDFSFDYQRLEDEFFALFMEGKPDYSKEQLKNNWEYFYAVVKVLKFFSPRGKEELERVLAEEAADLEAFVLELAGAEPDITLLEYIYGRFADLGIYKLEDEKITPCVTSWSGDGDINHYIWRKL